MFYLPGPYMDDEAPAHSYSEDETALHLKWYACPPVFTEWEAGPELDTGVWNTKEVVLACAHCGTETLTDQWNADDPCPACGGAMECVNFWGT